MGLKQQTFFLFTVLRSSEVQVWGPGRSCVWWGPFFWIADGCLLISSSDRERRERKQALCVTYYKGTSSLMRAPPSWTKPPQDPICKYHHSGDQSFNIWIWRGHKHSVYSILHCCPGSTGKLPMMERMLPKQKAIVVRGKPQRWG